jgi:hypothetical protein
MEQVGSGGIPDPTAKTGGDARWDEKGVFPGNVRVVLFERRREDL